MSKFVIERLLVLPSLGVLPCSNVEQTVMPLLRPHSIILASCKPGCKPGFQPGFRQVRAGFQHAFDQLSAFFCQKPGREPQQVRSFVHVLDKWNIEKKTVLSKFAAGFQHAFNLLATRFWPGLQLARIMECSLY